MTKINTNAINNWKNDTFSAANKWAETAHIKRTCRLLKQVSVKMSKVMGFDPEPNGRNPYWFNYRPMGTFDCNGIESLPSNESIDKAKETFARLKGWVEAANKATLPGGSKVANIWKLDNSRPAGSSYQVYPPIHIGPTHISNVMWKAYPKALSIARSYGIGNERLLDALKFTLVYRNTIKSPCKMAVIWAANALPQFVKWSTVLTLNQARVVLARARGLQKYYALSKTLRQEVIKLMEVVNTVGEAVDMARTSTVTQVEGVWGRYYFQHSRKVFGIKFTTYTSSDQKFACTLVEDGVHTPFHSVTAQKAYSLECARAAWKQQDKVKALTTKGLARLAVSFRYLVTPEDSIRSGNCAPGTEAWMRKNGVKGSITLRNLLKHAGDHRVARVLSYVANN